MLYLLVSFFISCFISLFIIRFINTHVVCDTCEGVQKFHVGFIPRIGGVAIYVALLSVSLAFWLSKKDFLVQYILLIVSVFPLFISGLVEDITKKVAPRWRLLAALMSAALVYWLLDIKITRLDIPFLDFIWQYEYLSFGFTIFAIAGVSHAFNIIDGFNGLCAGISILVFGAYAYIAFLVHDIFILYLCLILIFSILGFFIWNYPFGLIFLGDCGAYVLGFFAAAIGVFLTKEYSQISPWLPLLLVIYPVWETLFSIYRRKILMETAASQPDAIHFHTLVYRRLLTLIIGNNVDKKTKNALTAPFFWLIEVVCLTFSVIFYRNSLILASCVFIFIVFYTWFYFRVVTFRTPRVLPFSKK